ncbi:HalOD1 output domain-containing protein [Halogeometricum borinquense]|uniref:HalOD1 output domain-containing protein n=1 Tax=Halogeometricum borinquense TaxID=60847 RepID=UPI003433B41B
MDDTTTEGTGRDTKERSRVVVQHDWNGEDCLAVTIARAAAEAWTGNPDDAMTLPPVGSIVDPDALESLFEPARSRGRPATDGGYPSTDGAAQSRVRFTYVGYNVTISEDGVVVVEDPSTLANL